MAEREPVTDLIAAVLDTRRAEDEIEAKIRPLVQANGRARANLVAEIVYGLVVDGDSFADWEVALRVLGIELPATDYGAAERLGREFTTWLYLVAMKR